jgi:hypothetical protein
MMNVELKIEGVLQHGEDVDGTVILLSAGKDIEPRKVAEEFTLAELNMLQTHLDTFGAVLQSAIHERKQMNIRARMAEKGIV